MSALRSRRYQHKASLIATESHDKSSSDKCSGGIDFSHEDYHLCFWERKWEFDTFWWVLPVQEVALPSAPLIVSFEYCMVLHRDVLVKSSHLCVCVWGVKYIRGVLVLFDYSVSAELVFFDWLVSKRSLSHTHTHKTPFWQIWNSSIMFPADPSSLKGQRLNWNHDKKSSGARLGSGAVTQAHTCVHTNAPHTVSLALLHTHTHSSWVHSAGSFNTSLIEC